MKPILIFLTVITSYLLVACSVSTGESGESAADERKPKLLWTTHGFDRPESPVYDPEKNIIFLSNMGQHGIGDTSAPGFISKIALDGTVIEREWITGLLAPNGMAIRGSRMFLVDLTRLIVIDTDSGEIIEEYPAPDAPFLDGLGVDATGEVAYVADWLDHRIWRLSGREWDVWIDSPVSPLLKSPNAMIVEDDRLLVSTFGVSPYNQPWYADNPPIGKGGIRVVDRETKEVSIMGNAESITYSDGFKSDGRGGYLISDYIEGTVVHVDQDGNAREVLRFEQCDNVLMEKPDWVMEIHETYELMPSCGPADIQYFPERRLLLVPLLDFNAVAAYEY